MITQKYLKSILSYNSDTGIFIWINHEKRPSKIGSIAGNINNHGYHRIAINRKYYQSHRLAWLYVYGYLPKIIDHINGIKTDNRICNLRESTSSQNNFNRKLSNKNTSGIKGITWHKKSQKWQVVIGFNGINKYIGCFENKELAELVIIEARNKYHGTYGRQL